MPRLACDDGVLTNVADVYTERGERIMVGTWSCAEHGTVATIAVVRAEEEVRDGRPRLSVVMLEDNERRALVAALQRAGVQ